ncbi:hypothetical protein SUGI_0428250 [Cryptomeria japonica]|nr:hypothetical protein SUGI_0428250 [Cryptomeria japonica]
MHFLKNYLDTVVVQIKEKTELNLYLNLVYCNWSGKEMKEAHHFNGRPKSQLITVCRLFSLKFFASDVVNCEVRQRSQMLICQALLAVTTWTCAEFQ